MILSKSYKEIMDKIYVDDAMKQRILQRVEQEQRKQEILQNTEQEQKKQGIPQNTEQKDSSIGNSRKKNMFYYFHYKKLSICVAAAVLIFCLTSYFGVSTILQPGRIHQHNVASGNKKDSLSADANKKDENSNNISSDDADTEEELNAGAEADTGSISMDAMPGISQYSSAKELSQKIGFTISDIPSSLIPFKVSERTYYDCGDGLAEIQYYSDTAQSVVYRKQSVQNADISGDYTEYSDVITMKVQSIDICFKGEKGKYNLATWSKGNYSYSLYFSEAITEKKFQNILKITI